MSTPLTSHWWMALPAIPAKGDHNAYLRLRIIWSDNTRTRMKQGERSHEFVTPEWETHLMTTLWENFTLFEPKEWLRALSALAGLNETHEQTTACNWSYGFREKSTKRNADVVIGFDGYGDKLGCYVIETKKPGGRLTDKDLDPAYYLDMEAIASRAGFRKLICCVDEKERRRVRELFAAEPEKYKDCGIITWEELGGCQISLAQQMEAPAHIRAFIAGAIQYQFCQHGILPSVLAEDYLGQEPSMAAVDAKRVERYKNEDPLWARVGGAIGHSAAVNGH